MKSSICGQYMFFIFIVWYQDLFASSYWIGWLLQDYFASSTPTLLFNLELDTLRYMAVIGQANYIICFDCKWLTFSNFQCWPGIPTERVTISISISVQAHLLHSEKGVLEGTGFVLALIILIVFFYCFVYSIGFWIMCFVYLIWKTVAVAPYIVNYTGALFRQYPG